MANSSIIELIKNRMIKEIINDEVICKALNSQIPFEKSETLINEHIFDYNQNPFTMNKTTTFITVLVNIPEQYITSNDDTFVKPEVEIWIISHYSRMIVDDIPKVKQNRNDYLSRLLDLKFNGRTDFGFGEMVLTLNQEGSFQKDYLYRRIKFKTKDLNNSLCDMED